MRGGTMGNATARSRRTMATVVALALVVAACGSDAPAGTVEAVAPTTSAPTEAPVEPEADAPTADAAATPTPTATDPRPLTAAVRDLVDLAELPGSDSTEPPPGASTAIGTFIGVESASTELHLIELDRDSDWTYVDQGAPVSQRHLTQDAVSVGIAAEEVIIRNCDGGLTQPARVEVRPAGPLSQIGDDESLYASAWLTITCTDVDLADVDEARTRWVESGVNVYRHHLRGRIAGEKATVIVESADGVVRQRRTDQSVGRYDVDNLFDQIVNAIVDDDMTATVLFDPELGYPVEIEIAGPSGELLFFETRAFGSTVREPACEVGTGSALDLSAEPVVFVISRPDYHRWYDAEGCPVRIDIISDRGGPAHCEWDQARFLAFSDPIGSEPTRSFLWDPDRTLSSSLTDPVGNVWSTIDALDLPETAQATGYHTTDIELWLDSADPSVAYAINGDIAQMRRLIPPDLFVCA